MLQRYRDRHRHEAVAVLASGPTLPLFTGQEPVAIAVNGASLCEVPYQYFVCGDIQAPLRSWFYASERHGATRLLASFLAPLDRLLYPSRLERKVMRKELAVQTRLAQASGSLLPLYRFRPTSLPQAGHGWYAYHERAVTADLGVLDSVLSGGAFMHGATITGVALQIAYYLGARDIHLYGCTMHNPEGHHYFHASAGGGALNETQLGNLRTVIRGLADLGAAITIHGPSRLVDEDVGLDSKSAR